MAPHAEDPVRVTYEPQSRITLKSISGSARTKQDGNLEDKQSPLAEHYEPGRTPAEHHDDYQFDELRPSFPDVHWDALREVPYEDKGIRGDPRFSNLLDAADDVFDYGPKIGTELTGVNLAQLNEAQKCDLARLIATRGVVFFRNQDKFDVDSQRELGKFWGTLHKHATTGVPKQGGLDDVHVIYTTEQSADQRALFTPTFLWHSDVTYEVQPPSYTSLKVLTGPPRGGGGDTLWCSHYAIYDVLSAPMQKYLEGLTALHSADMQAQGSREAGRPVRREPVTTEHPLIRVNPVTGWKSLFFAPGFVTKIVGIPKAESDAIIRYLNELLTTTQEAHVRFQWGKNDVAIWDNRVTTHTATFGFAPHRRHTVRVAATAEKPYFDPAGKSQEEEYNRRWDLPQTNKDGSGRSNYND
ncbi:taurine dioxygenase [Exophiala viscosa]|uniref:Taurine dioxygenase n=1 Tax=Exophiala viscosa TaxID=2486360 RepID=A0AAN6E0X4_9EURO|nr:taurine dioxygenase [Exophiala viscosa]KAI1619447.1 taurine dioxygenase [Exophiala viscosa]